MGGRAVHFYLECGPVGVADKNAVSDARMTASTFRNEGNKPHYGRFHESRGKVFTQYSVYSIFNRIS